MSTFDNDKSTFHDDEHAEVTYIITSPATAAASLWAVTDVMAGLLVPTNLPSLGSDAM